jgi:hypothetical protein
VGWD